MKIIYIYSYKKGVTMNDIDAKCTKAIQAIAEAIAGFTINDGEVDQESAEATIETAQEDDEVDAESMKAMKAIYKAFWPKRH